MLLNICEKLNALKNAQSTEKKISAQSEEYYSPDYENRIHISFSRSYSYTVVYLKLDSSDIIRCDDNRSEFNRIRNTTKQKIIVSNYKDQNLYKINNEGFYTIPDIPQDEDEFDSIRFQASLIAESDYHLDCIMIASFIRTIDTLVESHLIDLHLTQFYDRDRLQFINEHIDSMCDDIKEYIID